MKKKVRAQPTVPYYSNEPAVSKKLMADTMPVPSGSLGNKTPKMVDKNPGRLSGVAVFASKSAPTTKKSGITVAKLGSKSGAPQQGKLRSSGNAGAHRIGLKTKI